MLCYPRPQASVVSIVHLAKKIIQMKISFTELFFVKKGKYVQSEILSHPTNPYLSIYSISLSKLP